MPSQQCEDHNNNQTVDEVPVEMSLKPTPEKASVSLADLLEDETTSFTLVAATDNKPAVVINGYTKASRQWRSLASKYGVDNKIQVTPNKTAIVDIGLPLNKLKALAGLVTSIEGLEEPMDASTEAGKKQIKELFINPRARVIAERWNNHLDSLGNELLDGK